MSADDGHDDDADDATGGLPGAGLPAAAAAHPSPDKANSLESLHAVGGTMSL